MQEVERSSYPAAEKPDSMIETLSFLTRTPVPTIFADRLTLKLSDHFPILHAIRSKSHLTSDNLRLLSMMQMCTTKMNPVSWYLTSFAETLGSTKEFSHEEVMKELHDLLTYFHLGNKVEAYTATESGLSLIRDHQVDKRRFMVELFTRFFYLTPPYFRFVSQDHNSLGLKNLKREQLLLRISETCKKKFSNFVSDDARRIFGWSAYFGIIRTEERDSFPVHSFSKETSVQYIIETMVQFLNEHLTSGRSHIIWKELKDEILQRLIFAGESFVSPEGLVQVVLEKNRGHYKWTYVERGPGVYPGFNQDPAKQMLQLTSRLSYQFVRDDILKATMP